MGYRFVNLGADVDGLCMYYDDIIQRVNKMKF